MVSNTQSSVHNSTKREDEDGGHLFHREARQATNHSNFSTSTSRGAASKLPQSLKGHANSSYSRHSHQYDYRTQPSHSLRSFGSSKRDITTHGYRSTVPSVISSYPRPFGRPGGSSSGGGLNPAHATLLEKKRKLYRETQQLPLWGIRKVAINPIDRDDLSRFPDNSLETHRYKLWTFIPLTIWEQFHRLNNIYYLIISIIHIIQAGNRLAEADLAAITTYLSVIIPFSLTLIICAIKDAAEDYRRFITDERINSQLCTIVDGHLPQFKTINFKTLRVGNIIRIHDGEEVPVDIVLLATSNTDGVAFVETSSINGETYLKEKKAVKETRGEVTAQAISSVRGRIVCEQPNSCLESFSGSLRLDAHPRVTALDISSFILKGSQVRNTEWLLGVVIYTGPDTRISRNAMKTPIKRTSVQTSLNQLVMVQASLTLFMAVCAAMVRWRSHGETTTFTVFGGVYPKNIIAVNVLHKLTLFAYIVPFSLSIVVDVARVFQGVAIDFHCTLGRDPIMTKTDNEGGRIPSCARTVEVNELLGQVDFVLADKTGTLTSSKMVFQCCSVGGRFYGQPSQRKRPRNNNGADLQSRRVSVRKGCAQKKRKAVIDGHDYESKRTRRQGVCETTEHGNVLMSPKLLHSRSSRFTVSEPYISCDGFSGPLASIMATNLGVEEERSISATFSQTGFHLELLESPSSSACCSTRNATTPSSLEQGTPFERPFSQAEKYFRLGSCDHFGNRRHCRAISLGLKELSSVSKLTEMTNCCYCGLNVSNRPLRICDDDNVGDHRKFQSLVTCKKQKSDTDLSEVTSFGCEPASYFRRNRSCTLSSSSFANVFTSLVSYEGSPTTSCSSQSNATLLILNEDELRYHDNDRKHHDIYDEFHTAVQPQTQHENFHTSEQPLFTAVLSASSSLSSSRFPSMNEDKDSSLDLRSQTTMELDASSSTQNESGYPSSSRRSIGGLESVSWAKSARETRNWVRVHSRTAAHSRPIAEKPSTARSKENSRRQPGDRVFPTSFRTLSRQIESCVSFKDNRIFKDLNKGNWRSRKINEFLRAIALCNSVVPELDLASMLYQFRTSPSPGLEPHRSCVTNLSAANRGRQHSLPLVRKDSNNNCLKESPARLSVFPSTKTIATPTHMPYTQTSPEMTAQHKTKWRRSASWDTALLASIKYRAAFPEEECLVAAAARMGYALVSRTLTSLTLECNGILKRYEIYGVHNFTPERQRMSIVVRQAGYSTATLYCKGSDSVILELCNIKTMGEKAFTRVRRQLRRLALQGLRSLVVARRTLTLQQAEIYRRIYNDRKSSLYRQTEQLEQLAEGFETDLELIGLTGVKDALAAGTADTIRSLTASGIRIWMVTGDFPELALHVGYSSQLVSSRSKMFKATLKCKGRRGRREALKLYEEFKSHMLNRRPDEPVTLLATGSDLANFLSAPDLQTIFFSMACSCDSVLCCRVRPTVKSLLAQTLRKNMFPEPVVLGVGDGLNDAALLQACHIGVALTEGAAMPFSDFVIPSIDYIKPLLFIHGRLSYLRTSSTVLWLCFKSFFTVIPVALYTSVTSHSSQNLYFPLFYFLYEFLWTAIPAIIHGVEEEDVPRDIALKLPTLYTLGRRRFYFSVSLCLVQLVEAAIIGVSNFYISINTLTPPNPSYGTARDPIEFGTGVLTFNLLVSLNKLCLMTHHYTTLFLSVVFGFGIVGWFLFQLFITSHGWPSMETLGVATEIFRQPDFWLRLLLLSSSATMVDLLFIEASKMWNPNLADAIRTALIKRARLSFHEQLQKAEDNEFDDRASITAGDDTDSKFSRYSTRRPSIRSPDKLLERFNPIRHRRVAQRLPRPRRFRLVRSVSQGGGYYAPLPLVTVVDRLTVLSQLKHRNRDRFITKQLAGPGILATRQHAPTNTRRESVISPEDILDSEHQKGTSKFSVKLSLDKSLTIRSRGSSSESTSDLLLENRHLTADSSCVDERSGLSGITEEFADEMSANANNLSISRDINSRVVVKVSDLINMLTLRFRDQQLEADYQVHRKRDIRKYRTSYRLIVLFLCLLVITVVVYDFFVLRAKESVVYSDVIVSLLPDVAFFLLFLASLYDFVFTERFDYLIGGFVVVIAVLKLISDYIQVKDGVASASIFSVLVFVVLRIPFIHAVIYNSSFTFLFTLRYMMSVLNIQRSKNSNLKSPMRLLFLSGMGGSDEEIMSFYQLLHYLPILLGIQAFNGFVGYRLEYNQRKRFLLDYQVEVSRRKQREILNTMLPEFIVDQMLNCTITKDGIPVGIKAEDRGTVSVIFCDVYEFQKIVACVEPTHLVKVLDSLFLCFDKCAEQFGCTKVETVFETYLAAAGLRFGVGGESDDSQQDAFDALDMSLAMLEISKYITYDMTNDPPTENGEECSGKTSPLKEESNDEDDSARESTASPLQFERRRRTHRIRVKIGLHSGRVISGVVGAKKPQYALFGDTVNTASRMKTTGEPDMIHMSEATYQLVKDDDSLIWEQRQIEVKGKGLMNTYLLTGVPGSDYSISTPAASLGVSEPEHLDVLHVDSPEAARNPMDVVRTVRFESRRTGRARTAASPLSNPVGGSNVTGYEELKSPADSSQHYNEASPGCKAVGTATVSSRHMSLMETKTNPLVRFQLDPQHATEKPNGGEKEDSKNAETVKESAKDYLQVRFGPCSSLSRVGHSFLLSHVSDSPLTHRQTVTFAMDRVDGIRYPHKQKRNRRKRLSDLLDKIMPWSTKCKTNARISHLSSPTRSELHAKSPVSRNTSQLSNTKMMQWLLLTFRDREVEERYKTHFYSNTSSINTIEQALIIFLMAFVVQTLVFIIVPRFSKNGALRAKPTVTWAVRSIFSTAAFVLWLLLHYRDRAEVSNMFGIRWLIFLLNLNFITAACTFMLANSWGYQYNNGAKPLWLYSDTLELFFYITILHHNSGLLFQHVVLVNALLLAVAMTFIIVVAQSTNIANGALFMIPIFIFANVVSAYFKEYVDRLTFVVNEEMQTTEDRGRELLHDMLPRQVLEEFQQDKLKLAYNHEKMTFLFADICGFTSWAKGVEATEVVLMLQQLFAKFDRDSTRFGLYKLCTIGDAYVAVSEPVTEETPDYDPANGAERVLEMAHAMIENIRLVRERLQIPQLTMRIGLHYGKCVGGVIGSGRLRYDLWGLDVLTGNMMESGGLPGQICVSEQLKQFLSENFPKKIWVINHSVDAYILTEVESDKGPSFDEDELMTQRTPILLTAPIFRRNDSLRKPLVINDLTAEVNGQQLILLKTNRTGIESSTQCSMCI